MRLTRRKSARFHDSSHLSSLPNELLYMIFYLTSFQGRASLVLSNKRFFNAFNPLLYQDVHLDTPHQLVQLYRSTVAKRKLRCTQIFVIGVGIFSYLKWQGMKIRLTPAEFLGRVLNETSSLRELEIHGGLSLDPSQWEFQHQFSRDLELWASKPAFLPKLAILSHPLCMQSFALALLRGGALAHIATSLTHFQTRRQMGYCVSKLTPKSAALELGVVQILPGIDHSARDVGASINHYVRSCSPLTTIDHVQIVVNFVLCNNPDDIFRGNMFLWTQNMLSFSGCSQLKTLLVYFNPPLLEESLDEQQSTLQKLKAVMPSLVFVVLGSPEIEWRRHVSDPESVSSVQEPGIPEWTPRPDFSHKTLEWWLRSFQFAVSDMEGDFERMAGRLRAIMQARWEEPFVPSVAALQTQISAISSN